MKKLLIAIIIVLIVVLIGQLAYYNFYGKKEKTNNQINNGININNENIINNQNTLNVINTEKQENQNIIIPEKIETVEENYSGPIDLYDLEKELYNFINVNTKTIYQMTVRKRENKILQLYDLNTEQINAMHIYSADDFLQITKQILLIWNLSNIENLSSVIDIESYNKDEDGYTTFKVTFNYEDDDPIIIKVYLANDNNTTPSIRFGVVK